MCERESVTKLCVKDVCEKWCVCGKVVCERECVKCVKCVMSAKAAGPGGGGGAGRSGIQNQKQEPHTEMSCHTKNDGRCDQVPRQVPRLPRETTVDVVKCHTCHARPRWMS